MVKLFSRELTPMKLSSLKSICLAVSFWIIPSAPVLANDGYWQQGNWCSPENNYCREINRRNYHYRSGNNQNYYDNQPRLEKIEYNGIIIRTGIRPYSDICSLVIQILGHCDGYRGFNESTRTHIFINYSNHTWGNRSPSNYERHPAPTWHRRGGCIYDNGRVRFLCN